MQEENKSFKAGFAAVVGRPNVGKSTLINTLLHQKVAAVSPRPQTTRRRQLGILTSETYQVVFIDTPGIHKPVHKLGEFMNQAAVDTLDDADVILWLVDASVKPEPEDEIVASRLASLRTLPVVVMALNKIDLLKTDQVKARETAYQALYPNARLVQISALTGRSCANLLDLLVSLMPEGLPFYGEEEVTDLYEREIAADLIREAALIHLDDEVPHAMAVRIDEYTERGDTNAYIGATLMVERDSHKGIVIGHGGDMIKKIGSTARKEIEGMSGRKIFLELRVKVNKNWRNNPAALREFGFLQRREE